MEEEQKIIQEIKISADFTLKDFSFFVIPLIDDDCFIIDTFEAIPLNNKEFSIKFQSTYWYILYHLLRDKKVSLDLEMFELLVSDINVFFDSIIIENNKKQSKIYRIDGGDWVLSFLKTDIEIMKSIDLLKKSSQ